MTVGLIFTKVGNFIEDRLLNCNCTKLANFEDVWTWSGGRFYISHTRTVVRQ